MLAQQRMRSIGPVGIEAGANLALIVMVPLVVRVLGPLIDPPLRGFGFAEALDAVSGNGQFTDIGIEVAASRGLLERSASAYDSWGTLSPLIGMFGYGPESHTHPPPALVLGIPLAHLDYQLWLSFWVVAAYCAIAVSMRLLAVPAWVAYPLALAISVSGPGMHALVSSYPMMALLLSFAWTMRNRPWPAGLSYAVLAVSRGVDGVLLLYPVLRRRWRVLVITVGTIVALTLIAVAVEPPVIGEYLTTGRATISQLMQSPDVFTFDAMLARNGLPRWLAWLAAIGILAIGFALKREPFWLITWLMFALTPIAWSHTAVSALPLLVVIWQSGRLGQLLNLLLGVVLVGLSPVGWEAAWPILLVLSAVGVLACPIGQVAGRQLTAEALSPA